MQQELIHKEEQEDARILTVDVQGWRIHVGYEPPREKAQMAIAIGIMKERLEGPTLAVGDWNQIPGGDVERAWNHHVGIETVEMEDDESMTKAQGGQKKKE